MDDLVERDEPVSDLRSYGMALMSTTGDSPADAVFRDAGEELVKATDAIAARDAEIARLNKLIEDTAQHWLDLCPKHPIAWEGAIDGAMEAGCKEILRLKALLEEVGRHINDLADDLETEVQARWGYDERLKRQLDRDMSPVIEARAFLAKLGGDNAG